MQITSLSARRAVFLIFASSASSLFAQSPQARRHSGTCGSVAYVQVEINNPFTARRITKTFSRTASETYKMPLVLEVIARDSAGRLRIERHGDMAVADGSRLATPHTREGAQINVTAAELGVVTVIFDCPDGKTITLQPGMKIAQSAAYPAAQPSPRGEHQFSSFYTSLLRHHPPADVFVEDLGSKTIEGIPAIGIRTTQIGAEDDGWKGKPIRIFEQWVSDDLAAMLIDTTIDLKKSTETTSSLVDIERAEPEPTLFQIPAGFKINPTPQEMPFQFIEGKSTAQPTP
jgi:hypothetical protein